MSSPERTAQEWFHEAGRCYIEGHQACAWCGGSYCVFRRKEGSQLTFSCHRCDFEVGYDEAEGRHFMIRGEPVRGPARQTMFEL
jgi:hypothetical protein